MPNQPRANRRGHPEPDAPTTAELQRALEQKLGRYFGTKRTIVGLDRRPSPYRSSRRLDELAVRFKDGESMRVLMKDLSPRGLLNSARRARPQFLCDPQRELNTYRSILPGAPPGTPAWYGTVVNGTANRSWLLLEDVEGEQLSQVGTLSAWKKTAAWIGRLHSAYPASSVQRLATRSKLLLYDREFYWQWLRRAEQFCSRSARKRRMMNLVAQRYHRVVDRLMGLPRTIIHGELYAGNVVIGRQDGKVRICPVDWEMAALGPGLVDLAALSAGWDERHRQLLARSYVSASKSPGSRPITWRRYVASGFELDFDCCRLHLAVQMVGWSDNWSPPPQHARDWLSDAVQIADRLSRTR